MSHTKSDEIDLGIVFHKIKEGFNNILISLFQGFQFILKNWWKLLLVAAIGAAIGYFIDKYKKPNKETSIIVQTNFGSTNYVYSAIEQLNNKLSDTVYLKEKGIKPKIIKEIEIVPVVNMIELLNNTAYNSRAIEPLLAKADFEDELLTSEVFYTEYKLHRINLETNAEGKDEIIKRLLDYLNSNKKYKEIKQVSINETKKRIQELEITINNVNNLLASLIKKNEQAAKPEEIYISTVNVTDLGLLLERKTSAIKSKGILQNELVKYDNIVTVINTPSLYDKSSLIPINAKSMAFTFVFLFLLFAYSNHKYLKIKNMANKKLAN